MRRARSGPLSTVTATGEAPPRPVDPAPAPGRKALVVRQIASGVGEAALAALVAAVVAAVGLVAFSMVQWPAFNSSNVTRALTTVGQVGAAALLAVAIALLRLRKSPWLAKPLSWAGLSTFVTFTLGMPLAATKLYLFGVSVDQEFRTEFLTRLTDSAALRDMTYADLPSFYPAGWFWIGGRVANLLGMDGWEVFKPYAIGFLAVAAVVALVLWSKLIRADWAVGVTAASTAVTLAYAAPEAYSAVIVLLLPPALVLAWGALYRPLEDVRSGSADRTAGGWGAVVGTGLFLGWAATFYTLYFLVAAFAVALMGLLSAVLAVRRQRRTNHPRRTRAAVDTGRPAWRAAVAPLTRLVVIGALSGLIALIVWGPYLAKALRSTTASSGTALHYLPEAGAELPLPMFHFSLLGALCLIGTIWLVLRAASSRRAQALGIGVAAIYLWTLLSMAATAAGTTLLSFRLEPVLLVLLSVAGAFGFVEGARAIYQALNEPARFRLVAIVVATVGALAFTQNITHILSSEITTAYTDTDGDGHRADQRAASAVSSYAKVDAALIAQIGRPRSDTVVLTADTSFLSFYPYLGFQALTSHYANPLADFAGRAATIERWSELKTPQELLDALAASPWRAPDAFLFRRSGDAYTLRLAKDVYPNDPNVERYTVSFPKELFADPRFTTTDIGPFTLVTVHR
ncbi:galactan 5-O-arabinofuranosyltransferase [Nocardia abscessus]|uniref:galactan 5-O-arabinofuranosyltransferase n=1 Tax=Nocardia abscessus TaxID=120957 RepID=UPI0018958C10|nr:galactan 5-O-arabinofuranosyltransferase [Nocardia abscessus]